MDRRTFKSTYGDQNIRFGNLTAAVGAIEANGRLVRDPIVGSACSEREVWEHPILILSMAALMKSAAMQNASRCACEKMLRQQ
jgi:hypothetical protein